MSIVAGEFIPPSDFKQFIIKVLDQKSREYARMYRLFLCAKRDGNPVAISDMPEHSYLHEDYASEIRREVERDFYRST